MQDFMVQCPASETAVVGISTANMPKTNCIQIRGKMPVQVQGRQRPVGFKFILPPQYPYAGPFVYLDEPVNQEVIDVIDYVDRGNRITNNFIANWANEYSRYPQRYNLKGLLSEVWQLYSKQPPLPLAEM